MYREYADIKSSGNDMGETDGTHDGYDLMSLEEDGQPILIIATAADTVCSLWDSFDPFWYPAPIFFVFLLTVYGTCNSFFF